ncbi:MAG: Dyp-type peroxidase [Gammaproteobacteria bacterium]
MHHSKDFEFDDLQGLIRFGFGKMTESSFLLLDVDDAASAKAWLAQLPVTSAVKSDPPPKTALQIAFSATGLRALGLAAEVIEEFSDEFIVGMSGDESRSRRLGDIEDNAPAKWEWGGDPDRVPHVLLMLYATTKAGLRSWRKKVEGKDFARAFKLVCELPTLHIGSIEPFGFVDGISQPELDWARQQPTDSHSRDAYSNLLAVGEVVLGYPNEYGLYTVRPLLDPEADRRAAALPDAEDLPQLKDLGKNGSYLVLRQLAQDVPLFWRFVDEAAGSDPAMREQLAVAMVGRHRNGDPLLPLADRDIAGIPRGDRLNNFKYDADPKGLLCPIGAHVRRANPRTGDMPTTSKCVFGRLFKILGFGSKKYNEDLIASTRFHRILRRGRTYGPLLKPEDAIKKNAPKEDRGLQFICLVANIGRQFEFVQNAWMANSKFAGLKEEQDPLLGNRLPLQDGSPSDEFHRPSPDGPAQKLTEVPQFVTVKGGGYFFMPGLKAIQFLASLPEPGGQSS